MKKRLYVCILIVLSLTCALAFTACIDTAKSLDRIEITAQPNKTAYTAGEIFDPAGMAVTAYYSDGTSEIVTDFTYTNRPLTSADTEIVVSYSENEIFKTVNVDITVSEISEINAETPIISKQPAGGSYDLNAAADALSVTANVTDGGTLSYQWYSNTANSTIGGTAVGTNSSSFTPSTATVSTLYYFVVITNTNNSVNGETTATITSDIVEVTVNPIIDAETPVISKQPAGGTVHTGDACKLTVTANVTDGGTLTYQWYSNTANSTIGGTAVGTNSGSFTPPTANASTLYYFVVVTNTNNSVNGETTAAVTSDIVEITTFTRFKFKYTYSGYEISVADGITLSGDVVIPSDYDGFKVTKIADYGFRDNISDNGNARTNQITSVTIPSTLTRIGIEAFGDCTALSSVNFGADSELERIDDYAFRDCTSLTVLTIPLSVKYIGRGITSLSASLTIYAEANKAPDDWSVTNGGWNSSARPVIWGCTLSADKTYVVSFTKTAASISNAAAENGISEPYRKGYSFGGWSVNEDLSGVTYSAEDINSVDNGTTLYAVWIPD